MKTKHITGIFLMVAATICVSSAFNLCASPRYTAQAEYSINWNQMGGDNYKPQKARRQYDNQIVNFKVSRAFVQQLCEACNIPAANSDAVTKNLRQYLKVTRIGKIEGHDLYRVQFSDDNQKVALKAVNLLTHRLVQRINMEAKIHNGVETFSSYEDKVSEQEKEQKLQNESDALSQDQQQEYSADRQNQIEAIQDQESEADLKQGFSGLKAFIYLVAAFSNPAHIKRLGVLVKG